MNLFCLLNFRLYFLSSLSLSLYLIHYFFPVHFSLYGLRENYIRVKKFSRYFRNTYDLKMGKKLCKCFCRSELNQQQIIGAKMINI